MGPAGPSGESVLRPEVKQHDLATVVTQLEALGVLVLAFDVGGLRANSQLTDLEKLRFGLLTHRAAIRELHVAVLAGGLLEESFNVFDGLGPVLLLQSLKVILAKQPA